MKKEWMRLDRLYGGIKTMEYLPKLIVVVDPTFEKSVILEADELNIVTVGLIDTNTDPSVVRFPIFTNDDALSAIKMIMGLIGDAIKNGNKGNGVKHVQKDYSKVEVKKIVKKVEEVVKAKKVRVRVQKEVAKVKPVEKTVKKEEVKEEKKVKKVAKKATTTKKAAPKKTVAKKVAKKATK
jgi:small subunit ribosomal protein S2